MFHLLDNTRCYTFVSNLINVARQLTGVDPISYDGYELTQMAFNPRNPDAEGFRFYPRAGGGGGQSSGDLRGLFNVDVYMRSDTFDERKVDISYALTALHEVIHLAGGSSIGPFYSDQVLAQAARILTGAPGYPDLHPRTRDEQVAATEAWGNYYDQQLRDYCAPAEYLP